MLGDPRSGSKVCVPLDCSLANYLGSGAHLVILPNWRRRHETEFEARYGERAPNPAGDRPQRVSSVTRITSTLGGSVKAKTFLRSARSCFAPEAVSLRDADDSVSGLLGEDVGRVPGERKDWSAVDTRQ
jgi:hypothetical protein